MDKEQLFKPRLPEADVDIPGVGTVRVRGLNRVEVLHVQAANDDATKERRIIALGMVDPELTEAEVGQWMKASAAMELEPVARKIGELSGILPDSAKKAYQEFEADPGSEFRLLPSGEMADATESAPSGTEQ